MKFSRLIALVFAVSISYAIVRYNVFKGVPLEHLPMYVLNKAVAMTALFFIGLSNTSSQLNTRKSAGRTGFSIAVLHGLISMSLLSPDYYAKLFSQASDIQGLSLQGELSVLAGCLGMFTLALLAWPKARETAEAWRKAIPWMTRGILGLIALHCLFYGWSGWWTPSHWPGSLPPITLLSFLFATGSLVWGGFSNKAAQVVSVPTK